MIPYRCLLLGPMGQVQAEEEIEAQSKEGALAVAREMLSRRTHHAAFELWLDARVVHTEFREERVA